MDWHYSGVIMHMTIEYNVAIIMDWHLQMACGGITIQLLLTMATVNDRTIQSIYNNAKSYTNVL